MRTKLAIEVAYLGTSYIGWQAQPASEGRSVYDVVHGALIEAGINSGPVASGRTDKGTHAMSMWLTVGVHRASAVFPGDERDAELAVLQEDINRHLPADVRCLNVLDARLSAHAMTGTQAKTYSYFVLHGIELASVPPWLANACWVQETRLDVRAMRGALPALVGCNDFRALCAVQDPRRSTVRTMSHASLHHQSHMQFPFFGCYDATNTTNSASECLDDTECGLLQIRFTGDGFLKHQCRRIVGLLVRIGRKDEEPAAMAEAIHNPEIFDRRRVLEAPSCGLWLESVDVDGMFEAPSNSKRPRMREP